ncbi:MAG: hypothetical protein JWN84_4660 [Nocardioides sp.]|nr:hypothetical protein [Nocardioides sp.]
MNDPWTTPEDIAAKVRRRWDDGTLLRAYATNGDFEPVELRVRAPRVSQIGDDIGAVRDWIAHLDAGRRDDRRYALTWKEIGGRHVGRNRLPDRAIVTSFDQAWALLGVTASVRRFDAILAMTRPYPSVHSWVLANPHRGLELSEDMAGLVAAYLWLDDHRHSARYLREISAPGIDTKFAERHRGVLAAMLGVSRTPSGFLAGLGLSTKPDLVRMRPSDSIGLAVPITELAVRSTELDGLNLVPRIAIIVENEITYLSVDVPRDGVVLWGRGFDVDQVGRIPWLVGVRVLYWGDIDTHGFAILDRLLAWLPQTESILMDRGTLLAHRDRWVSEDRPAKSSLRRLGVAEHDLYSDLVGDVLGERVRLEQERVDWEWATARLANAVGL